MTTITCPSHEDLTAYLSGRLSDADLEDVAEHLETCPECQSLLATLDVADDTLVATLRRAAPKDPCLEESQCRLAIGRVHAMFGAASSTADQPRDTLCGQSLGEYYLTEELGRGGMGRVYKALHTKLDRVVAVKVLSCGRAGDGNATNRFAREMKAVGRLVHPNIVQAYDAREIDGTAVLIMELVDGLDLAEIVRRTNNLPSPDHAAHGARRGAGGEGGATSASPAGEYQSPAGHPLAGQGTPAPAKAGTPAPRGISVPDACELVRQTALALQCAHDHGLVHRDVKPSNIMLARSGEVKLLDLGLARFFAESGADVSSASRGAGVPPASHNDEMTGTGQAMGTADYMAPEQASDSRTVDIRADIYSLGCTLYKLLTGRAPFSGPAYRTTLDKMNAHVNQPVPPIRQIVPEVPEQLAAVLDRMLAKDPKTRFATPAEVAEAVAPFCAGADLAALLKHAEEGQQGEGGDSLPSPSGRGAGGEGGAVAPHPSVKASRWKRFAGHLLLLLVVGGLCFALGIVITIKKDGERYQFSLPPNARADIDRNGNATVEIGVSREGLAPMAGPAPVVVNPELEMSALVGRWKIVRIEKGSAVEKTWHPYDKDFLDAGVHFIFEDPGAPGNGLGGRGGRASPVGASKPRLIIRNLSEVTASSWAVSVGSSAAPKWIDLYTGSGDLFALGLYEIGGKKLKLCLARNVVPGAQRPKGCAVGPSSDDVLLVLERLDRYEPSADEVKLRGGKQALAMTGFGSFRRGWELREITDNGKPVPFGTVQPGLIFLEYECFLQRFFLEFSPEQRAALREFLDPSGANQPGSRRMWQYALDPASQPKKITFVETTPSGKDELLGIYKIEGDKLTIAIHKGASRPGKFASPAGSGVTLMVLEYQSPRGPSGASEPGGGDGGSGGFGGLAAATPDSAAPPPTVRVTQPVVCNVCDYEEYSGRIEKGVVQVPVSPLAGDGLRNYDREDGASVKEGDLLADDIDRNIDHARAELDSAQAAKDELASAKDLKKIAAADARLKSAHEALDQALRKHPPVKFVAPISGKLEYVWNGPRGEFESPQSLAFFVIRSQDSMIVTFDVDEHTVLAHRRMPNRKAGWELSLPVVCALADDKGFPYRGKVVSVAEGIDPKTHTQRWQAIVPNKDGLFMPGMSVRVRVITSEPHKVMLIPGGGRDFGTNFGTNFHTVSQSNRESLSLAELYVVNTQNRIEIRNVRLGRMWEPFVAVLDGLSANDWFVLGGIGRGNRRLDETYSAGELVTPEKTTTPPLPWAAISVPTAVSVVRPIAREVTDYEVFSDGYGSSMGRVDKPVKRQVAAPVAGYLAKQHFKLGQTVKQGDLLAEILSQADAEKWQPLQERLHAAEEAAKPRRGVENAKAEQVRIAKAYYEFKAAREALESARAKPSLAKVIAPCDGKVDSFNIPAEIIINQPLFSITSLDSISAYFDVGQATVIRLRRRMAGQKPGWELSLPVSCGLPGDEGFPIRGKVSSVDSSVDSQTGTQRWRMELPNKDGVLVPGMKLRVRLATSAPYKALLLPEQALHIDEADPYAGASLRFVFVVNAQNVAERRDVRIGQLQDDGLRVVTKGLSGDDRVILDPSKVQPGMTVKPEEPPAAPAQPGASQQAPPSVRPSDCPSDAALLAAGMRLRVEDPQGHCSGSGTIIDVPPGGEALVLTCGHFFRDSQGKGKVEVDGMLIGVCNAAVPDDREGLFAGLGSIHAALDE